MRRQSLIVVIVLILAVILHNTAAIYYNASATRSDLKGMEQRLDDIRQTVEETRQQKLTYEEKLQRMGNYIAKRERQYRNRTDGLLEQIRETERKNNIKLDELREQVQSQKLSTVVENVQEAAVSIDADASRGSGVVVAPDTVVTNHHVVRESNTTTAITSDGTERQLKVIERDVQRDLVLLTGDLDISPITLGTHDEVVTGQTVIAIGNPEGLGFTVTEGIISARLRNFSGGNYIQTDVPINSGSSGGPLINTDGELIGINTFKIDDSESLGFAIPVSDVKRLLNDTTAQ